MSHPADNKKSIFTYNDYLKWPEGDRWELIDGIAYNMSPAPSRRHQQISMRLATAIHNYLQGKSCEVYTAPFDVRLPEKGQADENSKTVVQPDILVICDESKLDAKGCKGSPDIIIEITSPSTASLDFIKKMSLYERHGVAEYWIVHPTDNIVMIYKQTTGNNYGRAVIYSAENTITSTLLPGLIIDLKEIFA